jgi:hypothetical protein
MYLASMQAYRLILISIRTVEADVVEPRRSNQPTAVDRGESKWISELEPSAYAAILMRRLKRALLLRFYTESLLAVADRALLDRVIYASFCDCRSAGQGLAAKRLLDEARSGAGLFRRPSGGAGGGSAWST